jgi:hypothetical protein
MLVAVSPGFVSALLMAPTESTALISLTNSTIDLCRDELLCGAEVRARMTFSAACWNASSHHADVA